MNKVIYKKFIEKLPYTLQFSGVISLVLIGVYGILYLFNSLISTSIASMMYSFFGIFDFILAIFIVSILLNFISPFIYSYFAANSVLETSRKDDVTVKTFLKTYLIGNRQPLKGQLSMYNTLLMSFLIFIMAFTLTNFIAYTTMYYLDINGTKVIFDEIGKFLTLETPELQMEAINNYLTDEKIKILTYPIIYTNFVSLLLGLYHFIHKMNLNTFKYYLTNIMVGVSGRGTQLVFKHGLKTCKKSFYKDYYFNLFPLLILFIIIMPLSYFLLLLIPDISTNIYVLDITTILITLIVLLPFMPISFNLYEIMFAKYGPTFVNSFISIAKNQLDMMKQNYNNFTNVEQENIKKNEEVLSKLQEQVQSNNLNKEEENKEENNNINKEDDNKKDN